MKSRSWKLVGGIALIAALAALVGLTIHLMRSTNAADRELAALQNEVARQERDSASRQANLVTPITARIDDLSSKVKEQADTIAGVNELGERVSKLEQEAQAAPQASTTEVPAAQPATPASPPQPAPVAEQPQPPSVTQPTVPEKPEPTAPAAVVAPAAEPTNPAPEPTAAASSPAPAEASAAAAGVPAPSEAVVEAQTEPATAPVAAESEGDVVESGRFVILQAGTRIGMETFTLRQQSNGYTLSSTLQRSDGLLGTELSQTAKLDPSLYPTRYEITGTQDGAKKRITAEIDGGRIVATSFGATVLEETLQSGSVVAALDPMFPSSCIILLRGLGAGSSAVEGAAFSGTTMDLATLRLEPIGLVTLSASGKDDMGTVREVALGDASMRYYMQNGAVVGYAIPSQELFAYREDILAKGFLIFPRTVVEMGMPFGVAEQEYPFTSQGIQLAGTLAAPSTASAKMPCVLLLPDVGPFDRQGNAVGLETRILRDVARRLAQQGIATYRFDPRGVGASGGDYASVSLTNLENDAKVILTTLKYHPLIDPEKVYVVGYGAGGIVALRLAASGMANGVATLATSASSLGVSWMERLRDRATADGVSSEEVDALISREQAFLEFVRGTTGTWNDVGLAAARAALPWMNEIEYARRAEAMPLPLMRDLLDINPLDAVRGVRSRLFVLEGTKDFEVPASDVDLFAKAAKESGNQSVTTAVVENANHLLRAQPEGAASLDRHIEEEMDWGVLQPLLTWMGGPIIPAGGPGSLAPAS